MMNKQTELTMETDRIEYFLDHMANSLERIANILEQIEEANRLKPVYIPLTFDKVPVHDGD